MCVCLDEEKHIDSDREKIMSMRMEAGWCKLCDLRCAIHLGHV